MEKFNVTLDCFCNWPIETLVDSTWEIQHAGKSQRHPLKVGDLDPYLIYNSWPTRVHTFAGLKVITDRETDRQTTPLHLQQQSEPS